MAVEEYVIITITRLNMGASRVLEIMLTLTIMVVKMAMVVVVTLLVVLVEVAY